LKFKKKTKTLTNPFSLPIIVLTTYLQDINLFTEKKKANQCETQDELSWDSSTHQGVPMDDGALVGVGLLIHTCLSFHQKLRKFSSSFFQHLFLRETEKLGFVVGLALVG
jgi:hypothetical protein